MAILRVFAALTMLLAVAPLGQANDTQPAAPSPSAARQVSKACVTLGLVTPASTESLITGACTAWNLASYPLWPDAGSKLPDSMTRLYNVTGPENFRDRFHCLATEYGLDPTIIVFVQSADTLENAAVAKLLQDLDSAVNKNSVKRLHAFVVIVDTSVKDIVKQDVPRYRLSKKVAAFARDEKVKLSDKLPLCITSPDYLKSFSLDEDAVVTMVFEKNQMVVASDEFAKDKVSEEEFAKALTAGLGKLLPKK